MSKIKYSVGILILALFCQILVGCSESSETGGQGQTNAGSEDSNTAQKKEETQPAAAEQEKSEDTASTTSKVEKSEKSPDVITKIRVGVSADYPPFAIAAESSISGFDIDVIKAIALRMGRGYEVIDMPFHKLIAALQEKQIDIITSGFSVTRERSETVEFSDPYLVSALALLHSPAQNKKPEDVKSAQNLKNLLEEVKGHSLIVLQGSTAEAWVHSNLTPSDVNLVTVVAQKDLIAKLKEDKSSYAIVDLAQAKQWVEAESSKTRPLVYDVIDNTEQKYAFAVAKSNSALISELTKNLKEMEMSGELKKLKQQWGLLPSVVPEATSVADAGGAGDDVTAVPVTAAAESIQEDSSAKAKAVTTANQK